MSLPDWSRAYGAPLFDATIRSTPADFDVTEELGYEFDGEGEHDYLYVEKIGANTEWLSRQLAQFADLPARDVGYSGLKDRNAVTRQWFSVPRWNSPDWATVDIEGAKLLDVQRHSKKLRRGAHKANHFRIVLRPPQRGQSPFREKGSDPVGERLRLIAERGVPNYFGPQRFGRDGGNVELANAWSSGKRLPRHKRSIAISSARSFLFNESLHARVLDGSWDQLRKGDVANLDGTGSVFDVEVLDDVLIKRCGEMDIHPAGMLWGDGAGTTSVPDNRENWLAALSGARVKVAHRSLRLRVSNLRWHLDSDALALEFRLGSGAYATSVLREIGNVADHDARWSNT
jgi:tRNA pseudouridine13 synthase